MNQEQAMEKMIAPGQMRPTKGTGGVIQILVTSLCDKSCFNCTQGSNLRRNTDYPTYMSLDLFEKAVLSLKNYWGIVGLFGGNPAIHNEFESLCEILRTHIPKQRLGLWCNNPINESKCKAARETFNPSVSNLNVHLDAKAYGLFKQHWPESRPFGLREDSRHSPVFVSMNDLKDITEEEKWEAISKCEINHKWSASIGMFRGELRAWFCEIAMAQSILKQDDPEYPDTGLDPTVKYDCNFKTPIVSDYSELYWWELPLSAFSRQVKQHCLNCSVPLRGYGSLAQVDDLNGVEQTSEHYRDVYKPKRPSRAVQFVELRDDLSSKNLPFVDYLGGASK